MAPHSLYFLFISLLLLSVSISRINGAGLGINYGQIANNLPSPTRVASLLQSLQINRVKLYDADPTVLRAFANSGFEFIIGLGNEYLSNMTDPSKAQAWIQTHVQPYISQTNITCIAVGNEVLTGDDLQLKSYLLPAMQGVYSALVSIGLSTQITVTSPHSVGILGNSYPPSSGSFQPGLAEYLQPLLNFHSQINSPFLINAYPFFAYMGSPGQISLDYVLFRPNPGMDDPNTNLHYDNMLYAQIDAVYSAMKEMGHSDIEVRVSETGWPSKGDPNEVGATVENAEAYNGNLVRRIQRGEATPGKPSVPVDVHVFALFNEDLKPGPTSERNYGLYYPDGNPVYNIGLQSSLPQYYTYSSASQGKTHLDWYAWRVICSFLIGMIFFH